MNPAAPAPEPNEPAAAHDARPSALHEAPLAAPNADAAGASVRAALISRWRALNASLSGRASRGTLVSASLFCAVVMVATVTSSCANLFGTRTTTNTPKDTGTPTGTETGAAGVPQSHSARALRPMAQTAEGEPIIRVRIVNGATGVEFAGVQDLLIGPAAERAGAGVLRPAVAPLVLTRAGDVWIARPARGETLVFPVETGAPGEPSPGLAVRPVGSAPLTVNGMAIPAEVTAHPSRSGGGGASEGQFDIIEHVPIETYLPGVIAKELYTTWPLETFKAQAICARTYALQERQRQWGNGDHFDLEASQQDQAYQGVTTNQTALRAVRDTRGMVLKYQGRFLRAYYSSTCGGRAGAARETWPTGPGFEYNLDAPIQEHARDCPCGASPLYTWTVTRDRRELVQRITAFGRDQGLMVRQLKSLSRIEADQFNKVQRPNRYKVYDAEGKWYHLSAEQLRVACNTTAGTAGLPPISRQTRVSSGDFTATVQGETVKFEGRGFGHGVGMCQYGACALAQQGWAAARIIGHYYPGAELVKGY